MGPTIQRDYAHAENMTKTYTRHPWIYKMCIVPGQSLVVNVCATFCWFGGFLLATMQSTRWGSYRDAFLHSLERNSAALDWCEPNYVYTSHIAEFFNTISNVLFFTFPPILMWLFHSSYARPLSSSSCHLAFIFLFIVGVTSTYYHATLSLIGQLLDEISILWVIIMVFALWTPKEYFPSVFKKNRSHWQLTLFVAALLITGISWIVPALNAILLMGWGVPITYIMAVETRKTRNARAYTLGIRCLIIWFFALGAWVTDRLHCQFWLSIGFPYMHAMWHLLVALTSYQGCVLLCFYNAIAEWQQEQTALKLWPSDEWLRLGVPYVVIEQRPKCTPIKPV